MSHHRHNRRLTRRMLAGLAAGAWLAAGPDWAAGGEMRKLDGVKYLPEGRAETMWLRIPEAARTDGKRPAILIIPGGGWGRHFGANYLNAAETLADLGYVVAVIDYQTVSPQARGVHYLRNMSDSFPQCLYDCKTAVRFLRKHATTYGLDPDRIAVLGASAGGHLAAMTAVTQPRDGLEPVNDGLGDVSSAVRVCVSYYGAHDFSCWGGKAATEDDKTDMVRGSTVTWVDRDDPPLLVIHGDKDRTVPVTQSRLLVARLKAAGARHEYWEVPGADHGTCLNGKLPGELERLRAFLNTHL